MKKAFKLPLSNDLLLFLQGLFYFRFFFNFVFRFKLLIFYFFGDARVGHTVLNLMGYIMGVLIFFFLVARKAAFSVE